jgi:hypothetical protein
VSRQCQERQTYRNSQETSHILSHGISFALSDGPHGYSVAADAGRDHLSSEPCRNAQRETVDEGLPEGKKSLQRHNMVVAATANN